MDELDLIEQLRKGSHKAYESIFKEYYAYLCAVAYDYVHDEDHSQNIVEDVMLHLWEKREELVIHKSVKTYLMKAVRNQAIDFLRSQTGIQTVDISQAEWQNSFVPEEDLFERLTSTEMEMQIKRIIDTQSKECRKIFLLSRQEDKSYKEIANELGISINTVKYHIKRALYALRSELQEYRTNCFWAFLFLFVR